MLVLELLARQGDCEAAATRIGDLVTQLDQFEPRNHWLYHEVSLSMARLVSEVSYCISEGATCMCQTHLLSTCRLGAIL